MDEFFRALSKTGILQNEMIISCTPHPKVNGIYDIEYAGLLYDNKRIVGLRQVDKPKTVYDPRLISEQQMCQWMREAIQNGKIETTDGGQHHFEGYAKNGLCFNGYIENGKFTSLFPTNQIKQTKTSKFFENIMKNWRK